MYTDIPMQTLPLSGINPLSSPLSRVHPFVRSSNPTTINGNSSSNNNLSPTMGGSDSEYDFELADDDRGQSDGAPYHTGGLHSRRFQERQNKQDPRLRPVRGGGRPELGAGRIRRGEDFEDFIELRDEKNRREEAAFENAWWRYKHSQLNPPIMCPALVRAPSAPAAAAPPGEPRGSRCNMQHLPPRPCQHCTHTTRQARHMHCTPPYLSTTYGAVTDIGRTAVMRERPRSTGVGRGV